MTRLLVGLVAGLLSLGTNAAPPIDFSEQIADLKATVRSDRRACICWCGHATSRRSISASRAS